MTVYWEMTIACALACRHCRATAWNRPAPGELTTEECLQVLDTIAGSVVADPVAAALREGQEEVGIEPTGVEVLGVLPTAHIVRSGFDVTSAVGWWRQPRRLVPVDVGEIAAVHQVKVAELLAPENRVTWVHPSGLSGPTFVVDDLFIWGFTAYLLDGLFDLLEWTRPWDESRLSEIPARFLSDRL